MNALGAVLGVDPGSVRVGLAKSDPERRVAVPLRAVAAGDDLVARLAEVAREEGCTAVVVGLPLGLSGRDTPSTTDARTLAAALEAAGVEVHLADERLTSVQADRTLAPARRRTKSGSQQQRAAGTRDAVAAALLLQGWLDAQPRPA